MDTTASGDCGFESEVEENVVFEEKEGINGPESLATNEREVGLGMNGVVDFDGPVMDRIGLLDASLRMDGLGGL